MIRKLGLIAVSNLLWPMVPAAVAQGFDISWYTIDGGGSTLCTGGAFQLAGTIGQPDASAASMTGGSFSLTGGFWPAMSWLDPIPPSLTGAFSRRWHGASQSFDINLLPLGSPNGAGIESRSGGPREVIVNFSEPLAPGGASSMGELSDGPAGNQKTIAIAGVANRSCPVIAVTGVSDLSGNPLSGDNDVAIRVLAGDANADGAVNIFDLIAIRNQLNQPVTTTNFRDDVTADGAINIFDLIATRNSLNTTVSCP